MRAARTKDRARELLRRVARALDEVAPEWRISSLVPAGSGLEFLVLRGESPVVGSVAIRVPWVEHIRNENDPSVRARDLLRQEWDIAQRLARAGVPGAKPIALHLEAGVEMLVMEYVPHDESSAAAAALGEAVGHLHREVRPPDETVMQFGGAIEQVVAERIVRRLAVVRAAAGDLGPAPSGRAISGILGAVGGRRALLHMDLRRENLLCLAGRLRAIVDWSNALVADPALELARAAEFGSLDADFLRGYGANPLEKRPRAVELIYRLDAAVMLAVVFLHEAPDPDRAEPAVARVSRLCRELAACA